MRRERANLDDKIMYSGNPMLYSGLAGASRKWINVLERVTSCGNSVWIIPSVTVYIKSDTVYATEAWRGMAHLLPNSV